MGWQLGLAWNRRVSEYVPTNVDTRYFAGILWDSDNERFFSIDQTERVMAVSPFGRYTYTSEDGFNWDLGVTNITYSCGNIATADVYRETPVSGRWVGGNGGNIVTTDDYGVTWTCRTTTTSVVPSLAVNSSVIVVPGVSSGAGGRVKYSSDGITWTDALTTEGSAFFIVDPVYHQGTNRIWANVNGTLKWTTNGSTWNTSIAAPINGALLSAGPAMFLVVGSFSNECQMMYSLNGTSWNNIVIPGLIGGAGPARMTVTAAVWTGTEYYIAITYLDNNTVPQPIYIYKSNNLTDWEDTGFTSELNDGMLPNDRVNTWCDMIYQNGAILLHTRDENALSFGLSRADVIWYLAV